MGLLDENFEPAIDFLAFFDILDVDIKHSKLFNVSKDWLINEIKQVSIVTDDRGRIRPSKADIFKIVTGAVSDEYKRLLINNWPTVEFASGTIREDVGWYRRTNTKPIYIPKLHILVKLPNPVCKEDNGYWSSYNYQDLVTITLMDKRMMCDPDWLADVERRKKKYGDI